MLSGVPVFFLSKLQTEISLSTFEAKNIALSTAIHDLLNFRERNLLLNRSVT